MKDSDDELKEFFGSRNLEDQFQFDQENWEKLHAVLRKRKKSKKRLFIYLNTLFLLVGLTSAYFLIEEFKRPGEVSSISKKQTSSSQEKNIVSQQVIADTQLKAEELSSTETSLGKQNGKKNTTVPGNQVKPLAHNAKVLSNEVSRSAGVKTNNLRSVGFSSITPGYSTTTLNSNKVMIPGSHGSVFLSKKMKPGKTQIVLNRKKSESGSDTTNKDYKTITEMQTEGREHDRGEREVVEAIGTLAPVQNNLNAGLSEKDKTSKGDNLVSATINNQLANSDTTSDKKTKKEEIPVVVPKTDSIMPPVVLDKDSTTKKTPPKNMLLFEFGSDYLLGWKNNNKTEANGFNPVVGICYYNAISNKFGLSVGIQYTTINNLNGTTHTSISTRQKFGEESDIIAISATKMYYLAVPLKLNYVMDSKNAVSLGYTFAYLLDVQSKVETFTKDMNFQSNSVVTKSLGYRSGFSNFDGQLSVCYRRKLYKAIFINSELFYGLKDLKNNIIYNSTVFERSWGLKLTLSFNLLKK